MTDHCSASVSFNIAGPTVNPTRCYSSEISQQLNGLAEFIERPCEASYFSWSLAKTGPNTSWALSVYNIE